jgi:hypothetical protein
LLITIKDLNEAETTTLPVAGAWTIKDMLAHISGWAAWDLASGEYLCEKLRRY